MRRCEHSLHHQTAEWASLHCTLSGMLAHSTVGFWSRVMACVCFLACTLGMIFLLSLYLVWAFMRPRTFYTLQLISKVLQLTGRAVGCRRSLSAVEI